ncbi:MAG: hypothetical protein SFY70_00270 [Bacteroidia bacterium]|nr:hypothetical protein [Bacteroidia bacterium]
MYPGLLATALWLILYHLLPLVGVNFPEQTTVYEVLRLVAGVLLVYHIRATRNRYLGMVLAGVYFILLGLVFFLGLSSPSLGLVLSVLALASGVLLFIGAPKAFSHILGYKLFGAYLIVVAAIGLLHLSFNGLNLVVAVLAIGAGVLLLIRR